MFCEDRRLSPWERTSICRNVRISVQSEGKDKVPFDKMIQAMEESVESIICGSFASFKSGEHFIRAWHRAQGGQMENARRPSAKEEVQSLIRRLRSCKNFGANGLCKNEKQAIDTAVILWAVMGSNSTAK